MALPVLAVRVECYAGYRGEELPRCLYVGDRRIVVTEVLERWLAPDHRCFKLRGDDQDVYLVRQAVGTGQWELTMGRRGSGVLGGSHGPKKKTPTLFEGRLS